MPPEGSNRLLLTSNLPPGDMLMLTATVRDLHLSYPGQFRVCVSCSCPEIFLHNRDVVSIPRDKARIIPMHYPLYKTYTDSLICSRHFIHGYRVYLEEYLGLPIKPTEFKGKIVFTRNEKELYKDLPPFWIINCGWKNDFVVKRWSPERMRQVVRNFPTMNFIQTGSGKYPNPIIDEPNVVNMVGKTSIRKFLSLMYHASGVITPVSFPMHASAAVPMPPESVRTIRPCIVLGGGRECPTWETYDGHTFMSTVGKKECCLNGGCGKARFEKVEDGSPLDRKICSHQVKEDIIISECMADITADKVSAELEKYLCVQ